MRGRARDGARSIAEASMAAERKTKLSKNLLRMKVRGCRGARPGKQDYLVLQAWPRPRQWAYRGTRDARGPPALAFIHSLSACSALGIGNRIRNLAGFLIKPAVLGYSVVSAVMLEAPGAPGTYLGF